MKQYIFFLLLLIFTCSSCSNNTHHSQPITDSTSSKIVGNDVDKNGCKGSAGFTFSYLKNNCIRLFEDGIRLNAVSKNIDSTTSAFVIVTPQKDSVELFIPTDTSSHILAKPKEVKDDIWKNDFYKIIFRDSTYFLFNQKGVLLYSSK